MRVGVKVRADVFLCEGGRGSREERLFVTEVDLVREENVKEKQSHVSK